MCGRPNPSRRKSTSKTGFSSLPSQLKARRNCSLSAPALSQLASSEEVIVDALAVPALRDHVDLLAGHLVVGLLGPCGLLRSK